MLLDQIIKKIKKEANIIPIILCLFFIPLVFIPSFVQSFTQGKEIFFKTIVLLTLLISSLIIIRNKRLILRPVHNSKLFIALISGLTIIAVTNTLSPAPIVTFYGTLDRGLGMITDLFLFFFIIYVSATIKSTHFKTVLSWFVAGGLIVAAYALLQRIGIDPFFSYLDKDIFVGRSFSFLGNPGYLGQYLLLIIIASAYLTLSSKHNKHSAIYSIIAVIAFIGILSSQTRATIISLIICAILLSLKHRNYIWNVIKKRKKRNLMIGTTICCLIAIIIIHQTTSGKYALTDNSLRSLYSRFEIWNGTIELTSKRLFSGYGGETFYIFSPEITTKAFFTLEEDINLIIDKPHNEFFEIFYSHGIFLALTYLIIAIYLIRLFFKTKDPLISTMALLIIANSIQNQFSFSDISIKIIVAFCFGSLIALEIPKQYPYKTNNSWHKHLFIFLIIIFCGFTGVNTIYSPIMSQLAYAKSQANYNISYDVSINEHKKALFYTPYYGKLWYEIMMLDPSSMERALNNIELIEGKSGNLFAWKGNYYTNNNNPTKASEYFFLALEKNPYYPNWIRSYADMLYKYGDYENALYLYKQYLNSVPDFWLWKNILNKKTLEEQRQYRIFLKHVPDFWTTVKRVEQIERDYQE